MTYNQFMDNLRSLNGFRDSFITKTGSNYSNSMYVHILKKNTIKIEVFFTVPCDSQMPEFTEATTTSAIVFKKTEFGGYKQTTTVQGGMVILDTIENCLTWPEVKKTEKRFSKNQLLQNIVGREIIEEIGGLAKIRKLALDEGDTCVICGHSFKYGTIYQDKIRIRWSKPNGEMQTRIINYNMLHPSFNPDLLIKSVVRFAAKLTSLDSQMSTAWGEIENNWYLEVRNAEKA